MKVVILAGGKGTRLAEETATRPKPMVEIGGQPMLWHIMNIYSARGFKEFLICCGHKGEMIKEYFCNVAIHSTDYVIDLRNGVRQVVNGSKLDWVIGVIDTGLETMTGGRLLRIRKYLEGETFMVTYGDCVANIDVKGLLDFHRAHGRLATVTGVRPPARFGALTIEGNQVRHFSEKPQTAEGWINGGFFVFEPGVLDYISGDDMPLEREPLERLAAEGQLMVCRHEGFWQPMDTLRERQHLESLWSSGRAPWKVW